jgi:ribonuclease D
VTVERYQLLDTPGGFADAMGGLDVGASWALDTEFVRERTYFARLCLVQMALPGRILLIDPLRVDELDPLTALLCHATTSKIVHAARQDIEVLLPLTGKPMAPVFDTQIAAGMLGFPAQIGYADLVRQLLGVELEKGHARTNWAARPLKPEQLIYAADDVRYLGPVAEELEARLSAAGRRDWLAEDCRLLADPALYVTHPEDAWRRFKGIERLRAGERAVVRTLAAWREERAIRKDLPRGWVLSDDTVRELARLQPRSASDLQRVAGLPGAIATRHSAEILELIGRAAAEATAEDLVPPVDRLTPEQTAAVRRLHELLLQVAGEAGVSPEVLATRKDLTALVRGARDIAPLRGWRHDVIGTRLLAAI